MGRYRVGMKGKDSVVQYTIRGVPAEVDRALRRKAAQKKQSLNRLTVDALAAVATGGKKRADFSDLLGTWTPDAGFDEIIASQRRISCENWK